MAKKPTRGGRVTPKGTQPSTTKRTGESTNGRPGFTPPPQQQSFGRSAAGPMGPTRSGRRGNR